MSRTRSPFLFGGEAPLPVTNTLSPAQREALLGKTADFAPMLVAVFRPPGLTLAYVNEMGQRWLDPRGDGSIAELTLPDMLGVGCVNRMEAEMLPQAHVLGRWTGICTLRDVWGSEFAVLLTLSSHTCDGEAVFCVQATRNDPALAADGVCSLADRELLQCLLDGVPDTIYFKDRHSRFLRVNRAMASKARCAEPKELIGQTDFDRFTIEHAQAAFEAEQQIVRTGEPILGMEEKETWPDGRVTWVSSSKFPLRDSAGRIVGTFGISRDITASKEAEEARRLMEEKLQLAYKMESIGRLAAGIAHEVNTPTQFITDNTHFARDAFEQVARVLAGYRELRTLAAAHEDCQPRAAALDALETEVELDYLFREMPATFAQTLDGLSRVARIVRSLKEFSHPHSRDKTHVDLNHAIETAVTITRHEWKYVADVVTEFAPDLPPVFCVLDELNQVMLNLLVNAAHAIEDALKTRGDTRGLITLRTRLEKLWVAIEIEDNGAGIPTEIRNRIFEPFFTTKPLGRGSGQGLAIVHNLIVQHHEGSIDLHSVPGQGTRFTLRLPHTPDVTSVVTP